MKVKRKVIATVFVALSVLGTANGSFAGSLLLPGTSTGIPLGGGGGLPEGVYDVTIGTYGSRSTNPRTDVAAVAPVWLFWSTPWTIAGGRVLFDTVIGAADVTKRGVFHKQGLANPLVDAQLKWDLGGGFFGGFHVGVYLPLKDELTPLGATHNFASFQGVAALSYLKDGWDLSASLFYGTGRKGSASIAGSYAPDWLNLDVTATKKFGNVEIGGVAFASTDLTSPFAGYAKQSQFALGTLIGYNFGPVDVQIKLTREVSYRNYNGYETRVWTNLVIPLWLAPKRNVTALTSKY